ncbi:uncharacterized protein B0I36DRAFT_83538 [Microdochium trichocladiopsis]|uniref:Uncharacterized protein n=1 Tax=Microdochium trichocladiopsis TaxID=1682393 RepID=A0A9P8YCW0_9PEZI|nr:uncharacterized protein B0I36DRAFT_83538 [Microdochium trichocladiopsis]KAH7034728.1 hypothetical protein B0I36DRAFT_83538 [Microdochium trichocladiopsis]
MRSAGGDVSPETPFLAQGHLVPRRRRLCLPACPCPPTRDETQRPGNDLLGSRNRQARVVRLEIKTAEGALVWFQPPPAISHLYSTIIQNALSKPAFLTTVIPSPTPSHHRHSPCHCQLLFIFVSPVRVTAHKHFQSTQANIISFPLFSGRYSTIASSSTQHCKIPIPIPKLQLQPCIKHHPKRYPAIQARRHFKPTSIKNVRSPPAPCSCPSPRHQRPPLPGDSRPQPRRGLVEQHEQEDPTPLQTTDPAALPQSPPGGPEPWAAGPVALARGPSA